MRAYRGSEEGRDVHAAFALGDQCASSVLGSRPGMSGRRMKAAKRHQQGAEGMRPEYEFSGGVRGKYAARFARGSKVVVLAPDVAAIFRSAREVNAALRRDIKRRPGAKSSRQR